MEAGFAEAAGASSLPLGLLMDTHPVPQTPLLSPEEVMCLLPPVVLWLLERANPEAASLHSLAQSSLAAPTYQGCASSGSSLLFPRTGQDWPLGTEATWVEQAFSKQGGSEQAAKCCPLALRDTESGRGVAPRTSLEAGRGN